MDAINSIIPVEIHKAYSRGQKSNGFPWISMDFEKSAGSDGLPWTFKFNPEG